jgi:hypothetical protein
VLGRGGGFGGEADALQGGPDTRVVVLPSMPMLSDISRVQKLHRHTSATENQTYSSVRSKGPHKEHIDSRHLSISSQFSSPSTVSIMGIESVVLSCAA